MERTRPQVREKTTVKKHIHKSVRNALLRQYLIFMALIIVGVIIGSIYIRSTGVTKSALDGTGLFMQDILSKGTASKGLLVLAISSFFPAALFICFSYILGLCAIGLPFEILLPVLYGIFTGASLASVYVRFGVNGLAICLLFVMPYALITAFAVIISSREGFKLSRQISQIVLFGTQKNLSVPFRVYCFKYLVCFILVFFASLIQALSITLFSSLFFK